MWISDPCFACGGYGVFTDTNTRCPYCIPTYTPQSWKFEPTATPPEDVLGAKVKELEARVAELERWRKS
jgi:hypothetical protein